MTTLWFGEPWPSREQPAPVCADERRRVETPVSERCIQCGAAVLEGERGVVLPAVGLVGRTFPIEVDTGDGMLICPAVAWHLDCLVGATVPHLLDAVPRRP